MVGLNKAQTQEKPPISICFDLYRLNAFIFNEKEKLLSHFRCSGTNKTHLLPDPWQSGTDRIHSSFLEKNRHLSHRTLKCLKFLISN